MSPSPANAGGQDRPARFRRRPRTSRRGRRTRQTHSAPLCRRVACGRNGAPHRGPGTAGWSAGRARHAGRQPARPAPDQPLAGRRGRERRGAGRDRRASRRAHDARRRDRRRRHPGGPRRAARRHVAGDSTRSASTAVPRSSRRRSGCGRRHRRRDEIELHVGDGRDLGYADRSFDVAHASLVLHHLDPPVAVELLREMGRVARLGVVVNDLDRTRVGWVGAWLIGHFLTVNRYTRHDAPLSVRRAYRPQEAAAMLYAAGLRPVRIVRRSVRAALGDRGGPVWRRRTRDERGPTGPDRRRRPSGSLSGSV